VLSCQNIVAMQALTQRHGVLPCTPARRLQRQPCSSACSSAKPLRTCAPAVSSGRLALPHTAAGQPPCRSFSAACSSRTPATPRGTMAGSSSGPESIAPDGDGTAITPDPEEAQQAAMDATGRSRGALWFAAIKPPMYTVCIIPVLVSSSLFTEAPSSAAMSLPSLSTYCSSLRRARHALDALQQTSLPHDTRREPRSWRLAAAYVSAFQW